MGSSRAPEDNEKALELGPGGVTGAVREPVCTLDSHDTNPYLVAFNESFDSDNPKDWSLRRKWAATSVLSAASFNRILISTIIAPALSTIATEFQMNDVESVMCLSSYLLASAFGPLVIAPLSELYGRQPILHATNLWFLLWNIVCGFAYNKSLLLAGRFLAGFGASAIYVLAGGVLGDVWRAEQRGRSLGLYNLIPLLAASVGPIVGGVITQTTTWRWMFWSTSIIQGVLIIFSILMFRETYAPIILGRRARQLRTSTGEQRYHTATEKLSDGRTAAWILRRSLSRPMRLLASHPIVQTQAAVSGFSYGVTYLVISIYSNLWKTRYHQSTAASGFHYIAMCLGEIFGALLGGLLMDTIYRKLQSKAGGEVKPEFRLPLMVPASLLTMIGFLMFGWAAQARAFWVVVDIGSATLAFGSSLCGQVILAYVIDAYAEHTSSAQAGAQLVRSLTAFGFPLFAPSMYNGMGYGWGNTLLAVLAVTLCLPASMVLWRRGVQLRERAKTSF